MSELGSKPLNMPLNLVSGDPFAVTLNRATGTFDTATPATIIFDSGIVWTGTVSTTSVTFANTVSDVSAVIASKARSYKLRYATSTWIFGVVQWF